MSRGERDRKAACSAGRCVLMSITTCERYMAAEYYPQRFRAHFYSYRVKMQVFFLL